jgi:hypothetical protein
MKTTAAVLLTATALAFAGCAGNTNTPPAHAPHRGAPAQPDRAAATLLCPLPR